MSKELIAKLRYMGRQYSAGQSARGGGQQKHYLEEAADRIKELEAQLARASQQVPEGYHDLIMWLLGENGEFPDRPEKVEGKIQPLYWWRTELRKRYEAIAAPAGGETGEVN